MVCPKYKSKQVFYDLNKYRVLSLENAQYYRKKGKLRLPKHIHCFPSQHKFKVYLELVQMYGASRIKLQYPVNIIPKTLCYPNGRKWKIDFAIADRFDRKEIHCFVEAKGLVLPDFANSLAWLELYDTKTFNRLFIVFGECVENRKTVIKSLLRSPYYSHLITLKELKQKDRLS